MTPEKVRDVWQKVTDMSNAERMNSITEATGSLVELLDKLQTGNIKAEPNSVQTFQDKFQFGNKDLMLYALGGADLFVSFF